MINKEDTSKREVIYHITTLEAFYKIIKSGELWLFDVTKSNDPAEGILLAEVIKQCLNMKAPLERENEEEYRFNEYCSSLFEMAFGDGIVSDGLSKKLLSTSFCKLNNENRLSLWREYGDRGNGIAIGINREALEKFVEHHRGCFKFGEILYLDSKELKNKGEKIVDKFVHLEIEPLEWLNSILEENYYIKQKEYEIENELRLSYFLNWHELHGLRGKKSLDIPKEVDIMTVCNEIRSFYKFKIHDNNLDDNRSIESDICNRIIQEILIGPQCNATENEIRAMLKINDYNFVKIRKEKLRMK